MKKIVLVAVLATSAAMAAPFNGFSVGGNIGAAFTKYQPKKVLGVANTESKSKTNLLLGVFAGYTKSFDNVIAGADLGINFEKLKDTGVLNDNKDMNSWSFSLSPRVGYKFNETTAGYFKLGLGFNRFTISDAAKTLGFKSTTFAVTPTLGVEKFFNENVSVRGELGYKIEKIGTKDGSVAKTAFDSIKKNAVVLTVGAAYSF